jgi:hypothetical protein
MHVKLLRGGYVDIAYVSYTVKQGSKQLRKPLDNYLYAWNEQFVLS